jgi:hypothetical protein
MQGKKDAKPTLHYLCIHCTNWLKQEITLRSLTALDLVLPKIMSLVEIVRALLAISVNLGENTQCKACGAQSLAVALCHMALHVSLAGVIDAPTGHVHAFRTRLKASSLLGSWFICTMWVTGVHVMAKPPMWKPGQR